MHRRINQSFKEGMKNDAEIMFYTVNFPIVLLHFITRETKAKFPQFNASSKGYLGPYETSIIKLFHENSDTMVLRLLMALLILMTDQLFNNIHEFAAWFLCFKIDIFKQFHYKDQITEKMPWKCFVALVTVENCAQISKRFCKMIG